MSKFDHFRLKNEMLFMNYIANTIGVCVVIFITYQPISRHLADAFMMVSQIGWLLDSICGVLMFVCTVLYERPIRQYFDRQWRGEPLPDELTFKARQRMLNEPFFLIAVDLIVWITAGIIYSLILLDNNVESRAVFHTFFRSVQIGLITTVAAFFLLRSVVQRRMATRLFPSGGLYATPGTVRVRLSIRLAALLLACNLIPFLAIITILNEISGPGILSADLYEELRSNILLNSCVFMGIGIFLTVQLSLNLSQPIGDIIRVLKTVRDGRFDQKVSVTSNDEIGYTGDVINEMTEGLKERDRMRRSLELAKEVQQHFMPKKVPEIPGLDIAGTCIYCERTGGDYYDYIMLPEFQDGNLGIVIGDVSGHGIPSALLMSAVRSSLRQRVLQPGSLGQIVSDVNRQLTRDVEDSGRFMTLFFSKIDPARRSISWVRAGHDPAIFFDPKMGAFEELKGSGVALGVDESWTYAESVKKELTNGQIIVFCTDGVWEAHNSFGDMFGRDALYDVIRKNAHMPAAGIIDAVILALRNYQNGTEPEDDMTLVAVKIAS